MVAAPTVVPDVDVRFDLEDELCNDLRHARTAHRQCAVQARPGMILEANCGALFRTRGGISRLLGDLERCGDCVRQQLRLPCPYCTGV